MASNAPTDLPLGAEQNQAQASTDNRAMSLRAAALMSLKPKRRKVVPEQLYARPVPSASSLELDYGAEDGSTTSFEHRTEEHALLRESSRSDTSLGSKHDYDSSSFHQKTRVSTTVRPLSSQDSSQMRPSIPFRSNSSERHASLPDKPISSDLYARPGLSSMYTNIFMSLFPFLPSLSD